MPKPVLPASCVRCDRPMVNGEKIAPEGWVRHKSRGMCQRCHSDARRFGRLDEFPRNRRPVNDTVEMWEMLSLLGYSKAEAARKLGISEHGLRRALQRARVRAEQEMQATVEHLPVNRSGHGDAVAA